MLEGVISIVEGLNPKLIGIKLEAYTRTLATLQEKPGPVPGRWGWRACRTFRASLSRGPGSQSQRQNQTRSAPRAAS